MHFIPQTHHENRPKAPESVRLTGDSREVVNQTLQVNHLAAARLRNVIRHIWPDIGATAEPQQANQIAPAEAPSAAVISHIAQNAFRPHSDNAAGIYEDA